MRKSEEKKIAIVGFLNDISTLRVSIKNQECCCLIGKVR
jgi:hypothetical protein